MPAFASRIVHDQEHRAPEEVLPALNLVERMEVEIWIERTPGALRHDDRATPRA